MIAEQPFSRLAPNQVLGWLETLDRKLTPKRGLSTWDGGKRLTPFGQPPPANGRVLVPIHGTFSNSGSILGNLLSTSEGERLLADAKAHYNQVLFFDHPTLAVSPILNARELALALGDTAADIDIVCHSRGGLVARWWAEVLDRPGRNVRVIFVGSPLAGTSLASPAQVRKTIELCATFGKALGETTEMAGSAVPFLAIAAGLFQFVASVMSMTAKLPLADAGVILVPGLAAQSRVGNNAEIVSLRSGPPPKGTYFAVSANFEPPEVGWKFWKAFRNLPDRALNFGADKLFPGPNDLVVDTESMSQLKDDLKIDSSRHKDLGTTPDVHHCAYFRNKPTLEFLRTSLGVPIR